MTPQAWRLVVTAAAERGLTRLPEKAAPAVLESFRAIASEPHRLGKPLHFDFEGLWAARRGPYRVIFEIDDQERTVRIVAVGHRADIYRRRG